MPVVYMATNTVNGKRYIGATKFSLKRRKAHHLASYKGRARKLGCPLFYAALRKYGLDAFKWQVLKSFKTAEEAFAHERIAIADLRPEYNISIGGRCAFSSVPWNSKKIICLEDGIVFETLEAAASFYSTTSGNLSETCRLVRQATCKGKHFIYYTKELTEQERASAILNIDRYAIERRRKSSKPRRGNIRYPACSAVNPLRKTRSVVCVTTGIIFRSIAEAAEHYDVDGSAVCALCNGRQNRKTVGGLVFKYAEAA